jgi:hypothetical protein
VGDHGRCNSFVQLVGDLPSLDACCTAKAKARYGYYGTTQRAAFGRSVFLHLLRCEHDQP